MPAADVKINATIEGFTYEGVQMCSIAEAQVVLQGEEAILKLVLVNNDNKVAAVDVPASGIASVLTMMGLPVVSELKNRLLYATSTDNPVVGLINPFTFEVATARPVPTSDLPAADQEVHSHE